MSKRKADYLAMTDDDLEYELEFMSVDMSCNAVRGKIRALIDSGEMKVGEFQKAIGANSNAYSRFMGQNGPGKGAGSCVYINAWKFFKKRELRGQKTQTKKPKAAGATTTTTGSVSAGAGVPNVTGIVLPGEVEDAVEVYDTCDEIRRKINAHLKKPGVIQADFLRNIAAQYHLSPRNIQSAQLLTFRSRKGPTAGNTSVVYYGAYVYFEKLRIKEGKPKSKTRLEMEALWGAMGGMNTTQIQERAYVTMSRGTSLRQDRYGKISIQFPPRF